MKNIVRVWIGDSFNDGHFNGTAFFIDEHTLVTAKHVILDSKAEEYENIILSNIPDGGMIPVDEVILCSRDIAILKVKKASKIDEVYFSNDISVGEDVNVIGFYDKGSSQKNYENRVSGHQSHEHTYELQNHLTHGLSGSPVFLDDKICGVAKAINSSKNLTYMIPIEELCMEIEYNEKEVEIKKKKLSTWLEFIIPTIMPGIIFMIIYSLIISTLTSSEFLTGTYPFFIFLSFLSAKLYLYLKEKR
jgi:hypothetical protein